MKMYRLQREFFASKTFNQRDIVNKVIAANKKDEEHFEQKRKELKDIADRIDSTIKSAVEDRMWSFKRQNSALQWSLDFYQDREKRRSEQRREKRLRKKRRKAEAKKRNHIAVEGNEADEE